MGISKTEANQQTKWYSDK